MITNRSTGAKLDAALGFFVVPNVVSNSALFVLSVFCVEEGAMVVLSSFAEILFIISNNIYTYLDMIKQYLSQFVILINYKIYIYIIVLVSGIGSMVEVCSCLSFPVTMSAAFAVNLILSRETAFLKYHL